MPTKNFKNFTGSGFCSGSLLSWRPSSSGVFNSTAPVYLADSITRAADVESTRGFSGRCCPHMEQPTVVRHISDVTVNFQATLKDVLVCDIVLMALTSSPLPVLPSTEHVAALFFFVTCP